MVTRALRPLALTVLPMLMPASATAQSIAHTVYVGVTTASGDPAPNLAAGDFQVSEGGVVRQVTRAVPANSPVRVILLLDNSLSARPALRDVRVGAQAFVDALPAEQEITVMTIGAKPFVRVPTTTDRQKVKSSLNSISTDDGVTMFVNGLSDAYDRFVAKTADRWPIIVIVTSDGPEGSAGVSGKVLTQLAANLTVKDAVIHGIVMAVDGSGFQAGLMSALTLNTGGHLDQIVATSGMPDKLKSLGALITSESKGVANLYEVDYASDSRDISPNLEIKVAGEGRTVASISAHRPR